MDVSAKKKPEKWERMDPDMAEAIAEGASNGEPVFNIVVGDWKHPWCYRIDFLAWTQTNIDAGTVRGLRLPTVGVFKPVVKEGTRSFPSEETGSAVEEKTYKKIQQRKQQAGSDEPTVEHGAAGHFGRSGFTFGSATWPPNHRRG